MNPTQFRNTAITLCFIVPMMIRAEEGMWTFDNPPVKNLQTAYGFTPTQEWLDHVRLSSVRFMDGGSGSFISSNGLVLTNHHVAVGQLQKISTSERDFVQTGFYAATPEEELRCPDLEVNVLESFENVTARIQSVIKADLSDQEAQKIRDAEIAKIEKESLDATGLRSEVIDLYHGGEYWLYRYHKFTDVRLVMAPERQAAYYGGDSDNFTFPRHDLDMAFFRIYDHDKPLHSEHHFKWNAKGAADGELVFVSGNPGSTDRLYTLAQLEYQRDVAYPRILDFLRKRIDILHDYMRLGTEQNRRGLIQLFSLENSMKALTGEYEGLKDPDLLKKKAEQESTLRDQIKQNSDWKKAYGGAWDVVAKVVKIQRERPSYSFYRRLSGAKLYGMAVNLVFFNQEIGKPDAERLDGYHDAEIDELKFYLKSPAPIYKDLETVNAVGALKNAAAKLGEKDPWLTTVLGGRSPEDAVNALYQNTKLDDPALRQSLLDGGWKAIAASNDPLIVLARSVEPILRAETVWNKEHVESVLTPASERIAKARFAVNGKNDYPDATFTLRLSYGSVKGYPLNGTLAPSKTTLYGLFDRALSFDRKGDFDPPERFWQRQSRLDLTTPVNFVSTCDIIGGNSGSPVINGKAELVGLVFDGNMESLAGRFQYDIERNRCVAVHSAYIIEGLRKLYDAGKLADEIEAP